MSNLNNLYKTVKTPINLLIDEDGITVTFPNIPTAITCGKTIEEALSNINDCLKTANSFKEVNDNNLIK
jgi:predicted RNase H-like HicB family nuclease